jgi:transcriptional regulator with XRE-family HTH domain
MRELREIGGISQTVLAARLEHHDIRLDGTAITRIERGSRAIRLNEAVAIATALDVSLGTLLHPAPSPEEQLQQAREHEEEVSWVAMRSAAEHEAARARVRRLEQLMHSPTEEI